MDEEFEPKKVEKDNEVKKTEEEIKEEAKKEFEKEHEIKEQAKKELLEEQKREELKEYKKEKKKRSVGRIISRIIWTLIFLFVLFEVVIGLLDMQRLNDDKEPIWYFSSSEKKEKNKTETRYNLGLYVIVKSVEGKEKKISLKPFFLD